MFKLKVVKRDVLAAGSKLTLRGKKILLSLGVGKMRTLSLHHRAKVLEGGKSCGKTKMRIRMLQSVHTAVFPRQRKAFPAAKMYGFAL